MSTTHTTNGKRTRKNKSKDAEIGSLHRKTLELLHASKLTLPEIFVATGVPFYWLRRFKQSNMRHAPVDRVQILYEFLSGKKLVV